MKPVTQTPVQRGYVPAAAFPLGWNVFSQKEFRRRPSSRQSPDFRAFPCGSRALSHPSGVRAAAKRPGPGRGFAEAPLPGLLRRRSPAGDARWSSGAGRSEEQETDPHPSLVGEPGRFPKAVCPDVGQRVPGPKAFLVGEEEERRAAAGEARRRVQEMPHPGRACRDCQEAEVLILKKKPPSR
jgi:hypothetical protein